jgi:secreted trypsin-like serine protease
MGGGSSRNRHRIRSIASVESQQSSVRDGGRRIVGGHPATGTYRWVAKLEKLGGQWTGCVGNLISERWIITAAHCILNGQNTGYKSAATPGNSKIKYGCLNTDSASCKTVDAVRYVAHPCYTPSDDQDHDDIALIELRAPVEGMAGQFARVNGLNGSISIVDGENVILAGFGATQPNGGNEAIDLMQVTVPKRPTSICQQQNPSAVRNQYVNYDNVICTGGPSGKDSCNGDSGGPAIVMREGTPWLVGVLSVGSELPEKDQNCGAQGRVAVYTSVEKYSNWIYAVINNMYFCCRECPVIATRKPPYLSCPGPPPLAPATSCLDGEGEKSSPATGLTGTSPPLPPPRVSPRG